MDYVSGLHSKTPQMLLSVRLRKNTIPCSRLKLGIREIILVFAINQIILFIQSRRAFQKKGLIMVY